MDEWNPEDEIDWLTGEYTCKRERFRNFYKRQGNWLEKKRGDKKWVNQKKALNVGAVMLLFLRMK
jgi:hypothetical protein